MNERFGELLGLWALGALSSEDEAELAALVRADQALHREFADFARQHRLASVALARNGRPGLAARVDSALDRHPPRPSAWRWGALAAAVLVIALGSVAIVRHGASGPPSFAPAVVELVVGEATTTDGSGSTAVAAGRVIAAGTSLQLARAARVELRGGDGSRLVLGDGCRLGFGSEAIDLLQGTLAATVTTRPGDRPAIITTPHARLRIVGTVFRIAVATATRLEVDHGAVAIRGNGGDREITVGAGSFAVVDSGQDPTIRPLPAAVELHTGDDLPRIVDASPEGARFHLAAGVYRLHELVPKNDQVFAGEAGAVLCGARLLTGFTRVGDRWTIGGQTQQGPTYGRGEPRALHPEDLFLDDRPLVHAASAAEVGPGTWFFDYDADEVQLGDDPTGRKVEIGVTRCAFSGSAQRVAISGLTVEKYACPPQWGAIGYDQPGPAWSIEDCVVRLNHGAGVALGDRGRLLASRVSDNGQLGVTAHGDRVLIADNEIARNNFAGYDQAWEAGGGKAYRATGLSLLRNRIDDNHGFGFCLEEGSAPTCSGNAITGNDRQGLLALRCTGGRMSGNRFSANASLPDAWILGAQLVLLNSSGCEINGNALRVAGLANGICLVQQRDPAFACRGNLVHDNAVVFLDSGGACGADADVDAEAFFAANGFAGNHYQAADPDAAHWTWGRKLLTFGDWRTAGQDATGTCEAIGK